MEVDKKSDKRNTRGKGAGKKVVSSTQNLSVPIFSVTWIKNHNE